MPNLQSVASNIRAPGAKRRVWFARFTPTVVLGATVAATPAYGTLNLEIATTSGSFADVYAGMLVRVETSTGDYVGTTNVRAAGTISAVNLPIHEWALGDIIITMGYKVKVYNIPYLGDKLPRANSTFAPDDLTYSDQGTAIAPRVNSGGHWIGFVDSIFTSAVTTYATITMPGVSTSEDPDSGGAIAHLWTLLTATLTFAPGSASTDANPTLRGTQGYGLALHRVTDSSNSKAWTQFVCTQVYDATHLPYRILDASLNADEQNGWMADSVELYENATLSDLPDGSLCGIFVREVINGVVVSYGNAYSGRSHIKFVGFLYRDENQIDPDIRRIRFSLRSPLAQLASLPGFSKALGRDLEGWSQLEDLTVRLTIIQTLRYYSFFMEMFDLQFNDTSCSVVYPAEYVQKSPPLGQIRELADGVDARVVGTRTGELLIHLHPALIPYADRAAVTVTWLLAKTDYGGLGASIVREHWKVIETLEMRGFTAGATTALTQPIFSRSPGLAPGRGNQSPVIERLIASDTSKLNQRGGRRMARLDGTVMDDNGIYRRGVEWTGRFNEVTPLDVFDFYPEYVESSDFDASSNLRGVDLTLDQYYLTRISVQYHADGSAEIAPTWGTATNAPPGQTYVPPADTSQPPSPDPNPQPKPGANIGGILTFGTGRICGIQSDGKFYYTFSFNGGAPVWETPLALGMNGTAQDFVPNPYCPLYLTGTGNLELWCVTSNRVYFIEWNPDAPTGITVTSQFPFVTPGAGQSTIETERGFEGVVGIVRQFSGAATDYHGTIDGTTWGIYSLLNAGGGGNPVGLFVSPKSSGRIIAATSVAAGVVTGQISNNNGTTFAAISSPVISGYQNIGGLHVPFNNNPTESECYYGSFDVSNVRHSYRANGTIKTDITPEADTWIARQTAADTCPINSNYLVLCVTSATVNHVYASRDKGATFTLIDDTDIYTGVRYAGNDIEHFYLYGFLGAIAVADQDGTVQSRMGNIADFTPSTWLRIAGF